MQEIKEKKTQDLVKELDSCAGDLRTHRFATSIQQERNIGKRGQLRRTIARIKTELAHRAQAE